MLTRLTDIFVTASLDIPESTVKPRHRVSLHYGVNGISKESATDSTKKISSIGRARGSGKTNWEETSLSSFFRPPVDHRAGYYFFYLVGKAVVFIEAH